MVREISATALNKLATRLGNEPIAIIGVCWINEDPPPITTDTLLSILNYNRGLGTLGNVDITNRQGSSYTVDLSSATTIGDVITAIHAGTSGITVALNDHENGLKVTDTTGATASNLIVADNADGTKTAGRLRIRVDTTFDEYEGASLKLGPPISWYADRTVGPIPGKILEVSNLDNVVQVSANDDSQQISVTLDDTDGTIKSIMDHHDIHQRDVWVYQYFDGLDLADRFLLFRGKISSPVVWREADRTVSFDVVSQIEDAEVGFSPEEGEFDHIPEDLVGQAWPMIFGTVVRQKALNLTESYFGTLTRDLGIVDFTLPYRMFAYDSLADYVNNNLSDWLTVNGFSSVSDCRDNGTDQQVNVLDGYLANRKAYEDRAAEALAVLSDQARTIVARAYEGTGNHWWWADPTSTSFDVYGGEEFPQGQEITLNINGAKFTGSFAENTFHVTGDKHPRQNEGLTIPRMSGAIVPTGPLGFPTFVPDGNVIGDTAGYFFAEAGSQVRLEGEEPQRYVVSITPGTVKRVEAFMHVGGRRVLAEVPHDLYTVETETFGPVSATIVKLDDALSKQTGQEWEDDLYVTFQGSIGPNTAQILRYLITKYTKFSVDSESYHHVYARLHCYPSHFCLQERKQVLALLREIAFQARCALHLKDGIFYLRYLPETPSSADTITESDIEAGTLEVFHTPTEDVVTKLTARWRASGVQTEDNKVVLRHNVNKYGTKEREVNFYIYNKADLVIKSATFWLVRMANTWKKVRFSTPLNKLHLETFDGVRLDFNTPYVANTDLTATIEKADYDSVNRTVVFECWTPVKAGHMESYSLAHPAGVSVTEFFPTQEEIEEGNAGGCGEGKNATGTLPDRNDVQRGVKVRYNGPADPFGLITTGRRVSDFGQKKVSDVGDQHPGNPYLPAPLTFERIAPGQATPQWSDTTFFVAGGGISEIDIRTTRIIDSDNPDAEALLSSVFAGITEDSKLKLLDEVMVDDGEHEGVFQYQYDPETEKFGARIAFYDTEG